MDKYKHKYRISSARLNGWDYGSDGAYFVTICTKGGECYFGEIQNVETQNLASLRATEIGKIAGQNWLVIPTHFPFVALDKFIVMPNHVHGVLFIKKPDYNNWKPNTFGPQSQNVASVIRGYKASVKKYATMHSIEFAWQSGYYDHIIRSEKELNKIRQYIDQNPANWIHDRNNVENLMM